jgi:hypothetical protein
MLYAACRSDEYLYIIQMVEVEMDHPATTRYASFPTENTERISLCVFCGKKNSVFPGCLIMNPEGIS